MKKITLFTLLLFLTLPNYSQQISAIPSFWESSFWTGTSWSPIANVTYTFDANCLPTEIQSRINVGGSNMNASLSITSYNSNSFATQVITQTWVSGAWQNSVKSEFTYTGNLITELTNYKWVSGAWEIDTRTLNTYNGSNMVTENLTQSWVSSAWENTLKTETTYNGNNLLDVVTNYNWTNSMWENTSRVTHGYNGANLLTSIETSAWSGSAWVNNSKDDYTYDASNFVVQILNTTWNGSSYADNTRSTITNNGSGYPIDTINETWTAGTFWLNTSRTEIDYNECAVSTLETKEYEEIVTEIYPNPASDQVNIYFKDSFEGRISIFDTQGRNVFTKMSNKLENNINLSKFAGGVYLLIAQSKNNRTVKRIVIEK